MYKSFLDMEQYILSNNLSRTVALAGSHDPDALASVVMARRKGVISACLVGDEHKTRELLSGLEEPAQHYHFVHETEGRAAAQKACELVRSGQAHMPMKGKLPTADFMRAVLDKQLGFIPAGGLLCQATVLEFTQENRLLIISDCAVNVSPDYEGKKKILENAVILAHRIGIPNPRVAVVTPVETLNPAMQHTIDAAMLSKANQRGQITGCIVEGPLALDNAIDPEAARAKGVADNPVAGQADILIMPDLAAGNIFTKSLHYFAHLNQSGTITGANIPVIMTSRTDTPEDKYYSILVSVLQSL